MGALGKSAKAPPLTHRVDVRHAMATLDYPEMVGLADMFERWALEDERINPDHRTMLIELSSDYEAIALFCGCRWRAECPESPMDAIAFIANLEARTRGLYAQRR